MVVREEVKRESLGAIPYGPDEQKLNPYIGGNLQAINEFIKRDSELAAFYKQEVTTPKMGILVKIKTATPWAKSRYTLDGSPPAPPNNGIVLQPPVPWGPWHVTITPPTTSKARAYKKCFRESYVASRTYP